MQNITIFVLLGFSFGAIFAQNDTTAKQSLWKMESVYGFNSTQSTFVNWVAGGRNNISALAFINASATYTKGVSKWNTELRTAIGGVQFLGEGTDSRIQKTDDLINLASKCGYEFKETWFISALGDFRTQFLDGFMNPTDPDSLYASRFMAPAFSIFALGVDYIPNKDLSILMAPVTGKFAFVNDERLSNLGAFGVTPGKRFRPELGAYVKFRYRKDLMKNIEMLMRAEFFSNYLDRPQNIDVNLETTFTFKVNNWFSAMLQFNLLYDHDIMVPIRDANNNQYLAPRTQFRQILGLGIQYRIANFKK